MKRKVTEADVTLNIDTAKLGLSLTTQGIQKFGIAMANCQSSLSRLQASMGYQWALDELESATHLDRDMLNRWCEALAMTTTYTRIEAAEHLLHLWQMHFAELRLLAHAGFPLHWVFGR